MEDREPDLVGVPQEVGGEGLVPGGLVCLGLGGGPLDGELVDVDGHVGLQGHSHLVTGHELGQLEALGLDHRDLQPPVEHLAHLSKWSWFCAKHSARWVSFVRNLQSKSFALRCSAAASLY